MFEWVLGANLDVAAGAVISASVVRGAFGCIWLLDLASGWMCWSCFQGGGIGCFTHPLSYLCLRQLGAVRQCLVPLVLGPGSAGVGVVRFVACMLGGVSRVPWPFRGWGLWAVKSRAPRKRALPYEVYPAGKLQWHFTCGFDFKHSLWLPFVGCFAILTVLKARVTSECQSVWVPYESLPIVQRSFRLALTLTLKCSFSKLS